MEFFEKKFFLKKFLAVNHFHKKKTIPFHIFDDVFHEFCFNDQGFHHIGTSELNQFEF